MGRYSHYRTEELEVMALDGTDELAKELAQRIGHAFEDASSEIDDLRSDCDACDSRCAELESENDELETDNARLLKLLIDIHEQVSVMPAELVDRIEKEV